MFQVDKHIWKQLVKVRFLCFIPVEKVKFLKDLIVNVLFKQYKLNSEYLVGQAYDGATVMSGVHRGLQKKKKLMIT